MIEDYLDMGNRSCVKQFHRGAPTKACRPNKISHTNRQTRQLVLYMEKRTEIKVDTSTPKAKQKIIKAIADLQGNSLLSS